MPGPAYPAYGVEPGAPEGYGFTGMPAPGLATDGEGFMTTAPLPRTATASEHMAAGSMPHWYSAEPHYHPHHPHHHHHHHHHGYPGYATLDGLRRGPPSCRSRTSRGSSNRSLTKSELRAALREATADLVVDMTQEIRERLEPLIPPEGSPTTLGASPHRLQANHLVAGLSHTLGGVRSRPMPTPAAVPRSPFVPRTAKPPYSHVANSTRAELDRLGLTSLRAMVDVEPYGSSDLGGDPSDSDPPSLTSASPSEDDDPEDPDHPEGKKKKKKKRKSRRRHSKDAKAVATSKIVVNLPEFTGKDLANFAENFGRFLRLTGQTHASGRVKCDLLLQCCKTKYLEKQVKQIVTKSTTFAEVLVALERQYPSYETDLSIRTEIANLAGLPPNPKAARITELLADLDHWVGRLTPGSYGSDELLFWLVAKLPASVWDECQATAERKARTLTYEDLSVLLLELALEKESDQHLDAYRPGGSGSGSQARRGYQDHRGQGTTPKHARIMGAAQQFFWCEHCDEHGQLYHSPDCDQRNCFVVKGKAQEINTGARAKLPDHYRCTITCAFCGKRKHYEDECYHKQRLSAKRKGEDPGKGSGKGGGKDNGKGNDSGKGKSKGRGKGQDKTQGGRGGGNRQPDVDNKNQNKNGGNPNPNPGGNSEPSGGQSGPTTRSQTQTQQEQGAKREHEGGDDGNAKKRSRFMRMARKLRNKGFEVVVPAEF